MFDLKYSYILQDNSEEDHYNADTVVTLKDFSHISIKAISQGKKEHGITVEEV